jgi:hypothetical protein
MALLARGRSGGERTLLNVERYFWMKDRVVRGEATTIVHKGTSEQYANVPTTPLQGCLTGWPVAEDKRNVLFSRVTRVLSQRRGEY